MLDLNCDMGEVEKTWLNGRDQELMTYLDSINISCGFHAGNERLIRQTISKAAELDLNIGIHPGFDDPENFGRKELPLSSDSLSDLLKKQFDRFLKWSDEEGAIINHIKAHGALYNLLARDAELSLVYLQVIRGYNPNWVVFGLPESQTAKAANNQNQPFWPEAFADRTYTDKGALTPRSEKGALIEDPEKAYNQVKDILEKGNVMSNNNTRIDLKAKTFCIHGDGPKALEIAQRLQNLR
ncbi:5-oxoprolinase subunit PxpA [Jiulongibacter sediminis]|uniref:5-oxoprolinase subunit PxpA n=1 Tax=Jiulongibacter sediminis TaxID=1605367 RepID=UPI0026F2FCB0|nr:5-oxoprolinase subunit PxpA [Jiulongibacter sediminis]